MKNFTASRENVTASRENWAIHGRIELRQILLPQLLVVSEE